MKTKLVSLVLSLVVVQSLVNAASAPTQELFVSPQGKDSNPGASAAPLQSIAAAQQATLQTPIARSGILPYGAATQPVMVGQLCCEYLVNPLGVDTPQPRLSWMLASDRRGERQTGYRVLVASTAELLKADKGDLWDSGEVASSDSCQIEYAGKPLESRMRCYWKVRVWLARRSSDNSEVRSEGGSAPASWTMGLLKQDDWKAQWIEAKGQTSPWLRHEFDLEAAPEEATAYVNAVGYYEFYVNGKKVGDDVLAPVVSSLAKRTYYRTYDIKSLLKPGTNCIGLWLGQGWSGKGGPAARVQLEISSGGKRTVIETGPAWTYMPSTHTLLGKWSWGKFEGEEVDARRDIPGWNMAGCRQGDWKPVDIRSAWPGIASSQMCEPNRLGAAIPVAEYTAISTNVWELDFGTNLTGWLKVRMPPLQSGQKITIRYADKRFREVPEETPAGKIRARGGDWRATAKGTLYQTYGQNDVFISAGKPDEVFCSKFNYHGFRYAMIEGLPSQPAPGTVEALPIDLDLEPAGDFECSNERFNSIHRVNLWTLSCLNLGGYMVDCPHRERKGYGDGQVGVDSQIMAKRSASFYAKWMLDWFDDQKANGDLPHTAPNSGGGGGPGWGGAGCVLPIQLYTYYGDRRALETAYEPMRRYTEFLEGKCSNDILRAYGGDWGFIGDWVAPGRGMDGKWPSKRCAELFNNCYRVFLMENLVRAAEALGRSDEVQRWQARLKEIRPLIHAEFYEPENKRYVIDEQAYQVMPLMTEVTPEELRPVVMKTLEELIFNKSKGHLDTGMLGTYFLLRFLQGNDRNDWIFTMMNQPTYPGWGYMLEQGATTFWEQWNGYWSQIHSCFTSPGSWFYQGLAGIRPDPKGPGFKKILIQPAIVGNPPSRGGSGAASVTWVKCHHDSMYGRITSNWKLEEGALTMEVGIPANTVATVRIPTTKPDGVQLDGKPVKLSPDVKVLRREARALILKVGSGNYRFDASY